MSLRLTSGKLAGQTVGQVLTLANAVLGGNTAALPAGVSVADLNEVLNQLNGNFERGVTDNVLLGF